MKTCPWVHFLSNGAYIVCEEWLGHTGPHTFERVATYRPDLAEKAYEKAREQANAEAGKP